MRVVLDRDKYDLLASFTDEVTGEPVAPTALSFQIDCLTNKEPVRRATVMQPDQAQVSIKLTEQDTAIIEPFNKLEVRRVLLVALFKDRRAVWQHFDFAVRNRLMLETTEWKS